MARSFYKSKIFIIGITILIAIIICAAVAIPIGVVFGRSSRKLKPLTSYIKILIQL